MGSPRHTADSQVEATDAAPESLAALYPTLSPSYVQQTCLRYAGNARKIMHMLAIAASRTTPQLTPSGHAKGALCRPQGGDSSNWADTLLADFPMDQQGDGPTASEAAMHPMAVYVQRQIGATRFHLLGKDPGRYWAHVDSDMEMFANNS